MPRAPDTDLVGQGLEAVLVQGAERLGDHSGWRSDGGVQVPGAAVQQVADRVAVGLVVVRGRDPLAELGVRAQHILLDYQFSKNKISVFVEF